MRLLPLGLSRLRHDAASAPVNAPPPTPPNQTPREVYGHYVTVAPSPLNDVELLATSTLLDELDLGLSTDDDLAASLGGADTPTGIATPYAVSVFGSPIWAPDPFGRGNAYGDGRALSLGLAKAKSPPNPDSPEAGYSTPAPEAFELQLKGAGTTPFSRGGDGRAVLRSSVREFLVSEAMHHLRVPTTRALSLIASKTERARRLWYAPDDIGKADHPPDTMVFERCAITCRAAPSFLRVGHFELHARRATREPGEGEPSRAQALTDLRALFEHAAATEFAHATGVCDANLPLRERAVRMLREFAARQAHLTARWLAVGYVQGNMNSDNILLSGRTMDYGPFGFVERYDPLWSPFTSDAERKFGFERQPLAAQVNVMTLARALLPLLTDGPLPADARAELELHQPAVDALQVVVQDEYPAALERELGETRRAKLGLAAWDEPAAKELWPALQQLMARSEVDYTIFWRELAAVTADDVAAGGAAVAQRLARAFYSDERRAGLAAEWSAWGDAYAARLAADGRPEAERRAEMRANSPKYVPREWMLAEAYTAAEQGELSVLHELAQLFRTPYAEQPEREARWYKKAPAEVRKKGGVSFFS